MAGVNLIVLVGNLTDDPELKWTDTREAITKFGLAVNEGRDKQPTYFNITCWEKLAETVAEYARKGRAVYVQGQMKRDTWVDRDSEQKRERWYVQARVVQFLDRKPESDDRDNDRPRGRDRDDDDRPRTRNVADDRPRGRRPDDRQTRMEGHEPEPARAAPDDGFPF